MKRLIYAMGVGLLGAACSAASSSDSADQLASSTTEALGAAFQRGNLTKKSFVETNEAARQAETKAGYYDHVLTSPDGTSAPSISAGLSTLKAFIDRYGFVGHETITRYYNRGDLGIGREMHCVDNVNTASKEIACYVKNYAAGPDNTEFAFGMNSGFAFANMAANHPFATVAMVYRGAATTNRVFFVVYDASGGAGIGKLQFSAALDRYGISFANGTRPELVPGQDFNNQIPTNCMSCHGGNYSPATHAGTGSVFLPFDLDQFEYSTDVGQKRADQLAAFKTLNEMVRKVAAGSSTGSAVKNQLDLWYTNTPTAGSDPNLEIFESDFAQRIPAGWNADAATRSLYTDVVRRACRGCHVTTSFPFDTESQFRGLATNVAQDLCAVTMPHAFQVVREFWRSPAPGQLEKYFRGLGTSAGTSAADTLHACNPRGIVTLDPPEIFASVLVPR